MRDGLQRNALYAAADRVASKALGQALRSGIGLHHGNLEPQDRAAVEKLFLDRALPVLTLSLDALLPVRGLSVHLPICSALSWRVTCLLCQ